jgi:ribosome maturation protein SDO1
MSKIQVVKYKKGKNSFEIITKPGSVKLFLAGKLGWDKVLAADAIFTNYSKANLARNSDLKAVFGTDDINKCAEIMVREGDSQVSADERKQDIEACRRQILEYLHKSFVDQAGGIYPIPRLELILQEAKIRIDPTVSVHKQAEDVIKKMLGKAVFKKNSTDYTITVPKQYVKQCSTIVYRFSPSVHKEMRGTEGTSWKISLTIADFDLFTVEMNKITEGNYTVVVGHE